MALIESYFKLTDQYVKQYGEKTVLFMQVGSFFECYGRIEDPSDPSVITGSCMSEYCNICDLAKAKKTANILMAGFRDYQLDRYIRKMQEAGYTIVVYVQDTPTANTTRSLQGVYSPGTYFSGDAASGAAASAAEMSNNTSCIWLQRNRGAKLIIGMANIDIYTGRTSIFEVECQDDAIENPTTYDELERFISTNNPCEAIVISNLSGLEVNNCVIPFSGLNSKIIHRVFLAPEAGMLTTDVGTSVSVEKAIQSKKQAYQRVVLEKFFPDNLSDAFSCGIANYELATQAFVYLLNFIYEHNPNLVNKIQEPVFENKSDRLILANHSLKQLNVIYDANAGYSGKCASVMQFLNNCITTIGSRRFKTRLLNPTFNAVKLEREYAMTEYVLSGLETRRPHEAINEVESWRAQLRNVKDIEKYYRQIVFRRISPQSLYFMYTSIQTIQELYAATVKCGGGKGCKFGEYFLVTQDVTLTKEKALSVHDRVDTFCADFLAQFERTFVVEACKDLTETTPSENIFCKGHDAALDTLVSSHTESETVLGCVVAFLNSQIGDSENDIKIHETEKSGISLQTTQRRSKMLQERLKYYGKTAVTFEGCAYTFQLDELVYRAANPTGTAVMIWSPQIQALCTGITEFKSRMMTDVARVYAAFLQDIQGYNRDFENVINFVGMLDMLQNQCYVAKQNKYCRPQLCFDEAAQQSFVRAEGLRHCLIEHINQAEAYVTNDIALGVPGHSDGVLLYGTNAVGKTSLIRALGIAVIMAQAGLYVPCSSFYFKPYRTIFTRILGNDNLFKGMSTFVMEMSELRVILKMADANSLILGDELCSGTEIDSAISIFVAGLRSLHDMRASHIFATHLHEIVEYDEITDMVSSGRLALMHMEVVYDRERDMLVYDRKLKPGNGATTYGLEVCKSLHMPPEFLEYANTIRIKHRGIKSNGMLSVPSLLENRGASRYNARKLTGGECEICHMRPASEIHHLQHQNRADEDNFIGAMHKNHPANLANVCEECHKSFHHPHSPDAAANTNVNPDPEVSEVYKRVRTTRGFKIRKTPA